MKMALLFVCLFFCASCSFVKSWQVDNPDNWAEEEIEEFIEEKTGKNIDLTPVTGEETIFSDKEKEKATLYKFEF